MQTTARHRARTKARPAPEEPKPAPRTPPPTLIQLVWREGRLVVLPWPSAGADPTPAPLCSASWTSLEAAKAELPAVLGVPFEVVYQEPAPLPVPDLATRRREAGRLHRAQEAEETRLASKLEDNSERPTDGGEELREAKELLAPLQVSEPRRIAPGPHEDPDRWNSIRIGEALFPAARGRGVVKVKLETSAEWDKPKASGKDRVKSKFKGRKVATGTIEFHFTRHVYAESRVLMLDLDPNGPNADKAWPVEHPEAEERGANRITIESMSELDIKGHTYGFTIKVDAWFEPAVVATVGGTKTPLNPSLGGPGAGIPEELVKSGSKIIHLGEVEPLTGTGFSGPGVPGIDPGV